ncbi:MAG: prolyl oligopeptidase family serine peptidase [candidate division Zixibacteria bacterium]|nr:dienelactone hydrolase family protein [candidate division KSB1 bacterium]NIV08519.1 prolyl oligopeptidase family serine peptidase [candidate division Zixibacteria bacterium]NIS26470.1 dienelactone hydrolase family protein [candidate division KSB1 bacterium]NIT73236.1 dienelactone hydrolase family protein [candidate division KSB1 bacterium]NIU27154.1 dienelactone hydrolase family protein [candidate division KSB1 bacterium]
MEASAKIQGEEIEYTADDLTLQGYLAYDDEVEGERPGILVVHEWWGHNEYARKRARMLAELGYTAFALDMYGKGKQADHPKEAGEFSSQVMQNLDVAKARFIAALEQLQNHKTVDAGQVAAIGYCFGGGVVLNMALMSVDLDGVVSFHGSLPASLPEGAGEVKAEVLVCHGADDPFVKPEQVKQFKGLMEEQNVDYKLVEYPGAKHSFTNPDADTFGKKFELPLEYNKKADEESWEDMQEFFDRIFAGEMEEEEMEDMEE